jgi:hypothetical protein
MGSHCIIKQGRTIGSTEMLQRMQIGEPRLNITVNTGMILSKGGPVLCLIWSCRLDFMELRNAAAIRRKNPVDGNPGRQIKLWW